MRLKGWHPVNDENITAENLFPSSVEEAARLCLKGFRPVGGGTDLIVRNHAIAKTGAADFAPLFSCRDIPETRRLELSEGRLFIGSSVTLSDIISFDSCPGLLKNALLSIASPGIRNTATLAGNICNASPAADSLPALYLYNTIIETGGIGGNRYIPVSDFVTAPGKTSLLDDEIVVSVSLEPCDAEMYFRKIGTRAANALSKLSIAALIKKDDGRFTDFRLAVGACAPTVVRIREAEKLIIGSSFDEVRDRLDTIISLYSERLTPIDDQRSTARYRKNTAIRLIKNLLVNGE